MRILLIAHQFFPEHYAGVEVLTLGLARASKDRGHEPHVLAPKRSFPINDLRPGELEDYEFEGIPVRRVGRPTEGYTRPYRLDYENEVMAQRVREYVRQVRPDVVHAMHFQGASTSIIPAIKELDIPLVYTATDFWAICPVVDLHRHDGVMCEGPDIAHCPRCIASRHPLKYSNSPLKDRLDLVPDAALRAAATLSKTPLSRFSHPLRQVGALRERPEYIREKMELVDYILAPTRLTRDLLLANGIGGAGKIRVSRYGIDISGIVGAPRNHNVPPPLRVAFAGTLRPHKGPDLLVKAFRSLPPEVDATLSIHGNLERFKPYVRQLRKLAGNDERISFPGPFSRERVGQVLSEIDVLVVPSRWYENAPVVIYEAFAAKTPVVATDLGGMSEVVEHEKNGLLFELDNAEDLAGQLLRLYEEPSLLEGLRSGIGRVKTVEENMVELEQLYTSLLEEKSEVG
jgi:glycosyltransferase involved in cell wall biosynthesis